MQKDTATRKNDLPLHLLFILIAAIGIMIRTIEFPQHPGGLNQDEASIGICPAESRYRPERLLISGTSDRMGQRTKCTLCLFIHAFYRNFRAQCLFCALRQSDFLHFVHVCCIFCIPQNL